MNSLIKDYTKLYLLQDKFLSWWVNLQLPFYLTGGTALGRYYLNHRYSEDLDFFVNSNPDYPKYISFIKDQITPHFSVNLDASLFSDDFTRLMITDNDTSLKIEFVNDIEYRSGSVKQFNFGFIDTPLNILSNKLTAIVGRDEAKDIFDIIHIALNYNFNWLQVFSEAKIKSVINEIDVDERIINFPLEWFKNVGWLPKTIDYEFYKRALIVLADDFLLGKDNSLSKPGNANIEDAALIKS
jgi:predicted nucleotidyltransferase component of viral defense system